MAYLGRQPIVGNYQVLDALTATTTDTYALTKNSVAVFPQTPANCIVSLNGVIQAPFSSYTISGSNIVFASALTASDSIDFITVLGDVLNVGTPSDNTVTTAKLADSSVTTAKLNDASVSLAKLTATGTKNATTFLRGDNTFATPAGGTNTPAFRAYLGSNQNVTNNADSRINCNVEYFDTDNAYDSTTNYRFTVPSGKGGKYCFSYTVWCYDANAGTSNFADLFLKINGTGQGTTNIRQHGAFTNHNLSYHGSSIWNLNAGDYVELWTYQQFSSGINTVKAINTVFEGFKIIE